MPTITLEIAIRKATEYLKSLSPELLGEKIEEIRLENAQLIRDHWSVVLGYFVEPTVENQLLKTLGTVRRYRNIIVNATTGEIMALLSAERGIPTAV
ncbi:MAG TPA: hypothetical protein VGM92_11405 [Candidatus Kapabacteria bacterium]